MINYKPEIVKILKRITNNVSETYPDEWTELPIIIYEEENNTPHTTTSVGESMTLLRYRIDIYSNESTSVLKSKLNDEMTSVGFTRVFSVDTNDISNRRHTIMRYEGVIDLDNNKIYKN